MLDGLVFFVLMLIAGMVNILVMIFTSFQLKILYRMSGARSSLLKLYEATVLSRAINTIAPYGTGSMVVRPYVLKRTSEIRYEKSIAVNMIQYAFDMFSGLFALIFSLIFMGSVEFPMESTILTVLVAAVFLFFIIYTRWSLIVIGKLLEITRIFPKKIKAFCKRRAFKKSDIIGTLEYIQKSKRKGSMISFLFAICLVALFFQALSSYAFFVGMGVSINFFQAFALFWFPFYIGRISTIPGGFGVREGGMIYILSTLGVGLTEAAVMAILFRLILTASVFIAGVLVSLKLGINIFKLRKVGSGNNTV